MEGGGMTEGEAWYLAVLAFATFWAAISGALLIGSAHGGKRGPAWFWAVAFVASSVFAAYCFARLAWGGEASV
jgi:O-antigen ligase